jgi:hypothetical protein
MKIALFSFLFILVAHNAQSQPYHLAAGLRFGHPNCLSLKYLPSPHRQLEGFLGYRSFGSHSFTTAGATYAKYANIKSVKGLSWFAGGGASIFWSWDAQFAGASGSSTSFGLLAHGGLDYVFSDLPLNLSIDWMPIFFLRGYSSGFAGGYGALSARYVFN